MTIKDTIKGNVSGRAQENKIVNNKNKRKIININSTNCNISINKSLDKQKISKNKTNTYRGGKKTILKIVRKGQNQNPTIEQHFMTNKNSEVKEITNILNNNNNNINYSKSERQRYKLNKNFNYKKNTSIIVNKRKSEKIKYFDTAKIQNNVQIPKEYLNTIYYNLLKEEEGGQHLRPKYNYMARQKEINEQMRSILVDWLIDVHSKFGFTDETLFMTILLIDRYLTLNNIQRKKLQLVGITALLIACKHEEIDLPKIDDFIYITDNAYVKDEVIKMEDSILKILNFDLLYPSPIKFYEYLSLYFGFDKKMHFTGKYLMESFLVDIKYVKYKPSVIACACIYIVMKFFKINDYQRSYDKRYYSLNIDENSEYSEGDIKDCAKDICLLVDNIHKTKYLACQKKYTKPELEKVSIILLNN